MIKTPFGVFLNYDEIKEAKIAWLAERFWLTPIIEIWKYEKPEEIEETIDESKFNKIALQSLRLSIWFLISSLWVICFGRMFWFSDEFSLELAFYFATASMGFDIMFNYE